MFCRLCVPIPCLVLGRSNYSPIRTINSSPNLVVVCLLVTEVRGNSGHGWPDRPSPSLKLAAHPATLVVRTLGNFCGSQMAKCPPFSTEILWWLQVAENQTCVISYHNDRSLLRVVKRAANWQRQQKLPTTKIACTGNKSDEVCC